MTSEIQQAEAEQRVSVARRWFTEGWAGDTAMADDVFSETLRTNGVLVGQAGPKRRIADRLAGFTDCTTNIEDVLPSGDKLVIRLVWRGTHTGSYGGVEATGKRVEVRDMAIWRFKDGKVQEIWTIQDQFSLLQQVGFLPSSIFAA